MAVITVSNTGGNWNATTAWVGGVVPVAGDSVNFTATSGNLTVNVSTANLVGIDFTNYVGTITFNNPINTNGTVNLGTGGYTQAGASGLAISGNTTITSGGVTWSRTFSILNVTTNITLTLSGTFNCSGNISISGYAILTISGTINATGSTTLTANSGGTTPLTVSFSASPTFNNLTCAATSVNSPNTLNGSAINVTGSLTTNTSTVNGTSSILLIGTGTWSGTGTVILPLTINTSGTITLSGTLTYNTGTLTYTAGTVSTTGSTLVITNSCTLNCGNMNGVTTNKWNNITISGGTTTLTSDLYTSGNFITQTSPITINGVSRTLYIGGNITINIGTSGTASITLNGTGTWSGSSTLSNSLTVDTSGTITLSGLVYHGGASLNYITGTVITTGTTFYVTSNITLNVSGITWDSFVFLASPITVTLQSDLRSSGTMLIGGNITTSGAYSIFCGNLNINNTVSGGSVMTVTLGTDIYINGKLTIGPGPSNSLNIGGGKTLYAYGDIDISCIANAQTFGNCTIRVSGSGTFNCLAGYQRQMPIIFDTPGKVVLTGTFNWNGYTPPAANIIYLRGNIIAKNAILSLGTITGGVLTNMHQIPWGKVILSSGTTYSMNEFFSGTSSYKTIVQASSTTNYTISFQDSFEKVAKFVEISNCTLFKPQQLLVLGDTRAKGTNIGIRYTNQSPNGLSKNIGKLSPSLTFDTGGILPDPNFVKLK